MRRILCIGDSNTRGFDPRSYGGGRYAPDVRWTGRLPGWETVNDGINGRTIPTAREYPDTERLLRGEPIDAVCVMLGTNDLLRGASAEEAGAALENYLRFLRGAAGDTPIVLIAPPPFRPGEWVTSAAQILESEKLAGVYRALAARSGLFFADAGRWNVELSFDGVHFTAGGHAAFAAGLSETLSDIERNTISI